MKNPTLNRWVLELNEYKIVFSHIAGKENIVTDLEMTQGQFSHRTEPKLDLSHKLLPRSPTMAFSSMRENVTPTLS